MNGRPAENTFDNSLVGENIHPFRWGDHVVRSTIPAQVDKTFWRNVMYEPTDLVGVGFNNYFVIVARVDDPSNRTVGVGNVVVDIGSQVFQPHLLAAILETRRRGIVDI